MPLTFLFYRQIALSDIHYTVCCDIMSSVPLTLISLLISLFLLLFLTCSPKSVGRGFIFKKNLRREEVGGGGGVEAQSTLNRDAMCLK